MSNQTNNQKQASTVLPGELPLALDLESFLYEAIDSSTFINIQEWSKHFDEIPVDPYIKEGYRYKSIAWFRVKHCLSPAIKEIDNHIAEVNKLSGITEVESEKYLSTSHPSWTSQETGYCCWELPQYAATITYLLRCP